MPPTGTILQSPDAPYMPLPVGAFGAPPPLAGVATRRLQEQAAARGLLLCPTIYDAKSLAGGLATEQLDMVPDSREGPFFCTRIQLSTVAGGNDVEIGVRSGSRDLTEGRVSVAAFLESLGDTSYTSVAFSDAAQPEFPACVVVLRGDALRVTLAWLVGTSNIIDGAVASGFHLRRADGSRLGPEADELAAIVRAEGEFYCAGLNDVRIGGASLNISSNAIVDRLRIATAGTDVANKCTSVAASIGNQEVIPQRATVLLSAATRIAGITMQAIRWPVRAGQRLQLTPQYGAPAPANNYSFTIMGRRAQT